MSFAPEPCGAVTAGRSAVQAFDRGRKGLRPPPKPKPLQLTDFRSLALRDRMRSLRCFENLALFTHLGLRWIRLELEVDPQDAR